MEHPFPELVPQLPSSQELETRRKAQVQFVDQLKKDDSTLLLLVARFIARRIIAETTKLTQQPGTPLPKRTENDFTDAENGEYNLDDHLERLRYIDVPLSPDSISRLTGVLVSALSSLAGLLDDERIGVMLGKMAYNAYGVCFGGGRDDKVSLSLHNHLSF